MTFDVLEHFQLRFEVPFMDDPDEIAEHVSPKLIGRIGLENYGGYIVFELFY